MTEHNDPKINFSFKLIDLYTILENLISLNDSDYDENISNFLKEIHLRLGLTIATPVIEEIPFSVEKYSVQHALPDLSEFYTKLMNITELNTSLIPIIPNNDITYFPFYKGEKDETKRHLSAIQFHEAQTWRFTLEFLRCLTFILNKQKFCDPSTFKDSILQWLSHLKKNLV